MRYAVAHGRRRTGRPAEVGAAAVAALRSDGHEVTEIVANTMAQARAACAALIADGLDVLIVVGGDGLVSMGTDLCASHGTALAILPAGTGNDNARSLGIPLRGAGAAREALQIVREDRRRRLDTLLLPGGVGVGQRDRHVLGSLNCALDARIAARADAWLPRRLGPASYTLSALVEVALLQRQPPLTFTLDIDGRREVLDALVLAPANMPFVGGGLHLAPGADPTDGLLDLVIVGPVSPRQAVGVLRAVRAGTHTRHPAVRMVRAREVRIDGPRDLVVHGDGEAIRPLPLAVRVDPASLQVVAPPLT